MVRIELTTSPLPRVCSTTELHGQGARDSIKVSIPFRWPPAWLSWLARSREHARLPILPVEAASGRGQARAPLQRRGGALALMQPVAQATRTLTRPSAVIITRSPLRITLGGGGTDL